MIPADAPPPGGVPARSIVETIDLLAASRPGAIALEFPADQVALSWADLAARSRSWAAALAGAGVRRGQLVGVLLGNESRFIPLIVGAWRAGAAVAPMPIPGSFASSDAYAGHIGAMVADGGIEHVVYDPRPLPDLERLMAATPGAGWIAVGDGGNGEDDAPERPVEGEALAVVQYTSGSTSAPKGVELTHANITAGFAAYAAATGIGEGDCWGVWLPLFHDFGLVSTLTALSVGAGACVWPPATFLRHPGRWLADFGRRRLTHYSGPNFSFDLMRESYAPDLFDGIDLSAWRVAVNGAEPVNPLTVDRFHQRFAGHGFSAETMVPGYGMAEATLAVTVPRLGAGPRVLSVSRRALAARGHAEPVAEGDPDARSVVSVGRPVPGIELRIVDQLDETLGEREVGEILVKGPAVTRGYRGHAAAARFGWLPTGDLGFIADGDLFIVGRSKDTIIVRGTKYHPEDVEPLVREVEGVHHGRCAVVARGETDERLAVVAETHVDGDELGRLRAGIRTRLVRGLGIAEIDVYLVATRTIPVTSSGKTRRRVLRRHLEAGELVDLEDRLPEASSAAKRQAAGATPTGR
ncbi:MAG TPA: AMP-binding protein [Candidatus Solibacter sp.]|nr:AMP-binding protein [Candidatus Solibacter sp.]